MCMTIKETHSFYCCRTSVSLQLHLSLSHMMIMMMMMSSPRKVMNGKRLPSIEKELQWLLTHEISDGLDRRPSPTHKNGITQTAHKQQQQQQRCESATCAIRYVWLTQMAAKPLPCPTKHKDIEIYHKVWKTTRTVKMSHLNYSYIFSGERTFQWGKQPKLAGNILKEKSGRETNFLAGPSYYLGGEAFQRGCYWDCTYCNCFKLNKIWYYCSCINNWT